MRSQFLSLVSHELRTPLPVIKTSAQLLQLSADPANQETIRRRLGVAAEEIAQFVRYDYLVINDDFDEAVRELEAILIAERCKRRQRTYQASGILESFR